MAEEKYPNSPNRPDLAVFPPWGQTEENSRRGPLDASTAPGTPGTRDQGLGSPAHPQRMKGSCCARRSKTGPHPDRRPAEDHCCNNAMPRDNKAAPLQWYRSKSSVHIRKSWPVVPVQENVPFFSQENKVS